MKLRAACRLLAAILLSIFVAPARDPTPPPKAAPITVGGRAVEVSVSAAGDRALRIAISPLDGAGTPQLLKDEPVLMRRVWPNPLLRMRSASSPLQARVGAMAIDQGHMARLTRAALTNRHVLLHRAL